MPQDHIHPPLPTERISGLKFVQIYLKQGELLIPHLFLSQSNPDRHGLIIKRCLETLAIEAPTSEEQHLRLFNFPARETKDYAVVGMGQSLIRKGIFTAYGASVDYELISNEEHFQRLEKFVPEVKFIIEQSKLI